MQIVERNGSAIRGYCIILPAILFYHPEDTESMWWWTRNDEGGIWLCFLKRADAVSYCEKHFIDITVP